MSKYKEASSAAKININKFQIEFDLHAEKIKVGDSENPHVNIF